MAATAMPVERFAVLPVLASSQRGWLAHLRLPRVARALISIAVLDGTMWLWHRANHRVPLLWRFHRAHHLDPELDASTALRFHPVEVAMSVAFRALQQRVLGPGPQIALLHEAITQAAVLFHHANLDLGSRVDRALAQVVVTPRMHGIHHLRDWSCLASNLGVILSIWDTAAGTRRWDAPIDARSIGVPDQAVLSS